MHPQDNRIAVVIPAYRVRGTVLSVIEAIPTEVSGIFVVDDKCPENTGEFVATHCHDPRVKVLYHRENQGVGGAVVTGYRRAASERFAVVVKVDGDGQMSPSLIPRFVEPILTGTADYTKGNRFYRLESLRGMPSLRLLGNAGLSFFTKLASGYYHIFDPTNGYTAIHVGVLELLPLEKLSRRYFFESDMLFRLSTVGAVVTDIPMDAHYADEPSSLRVRDVFASFLFGNSVNFVKRVFYNYFLRDFNPASMQLLASFVLMAFGCTFGAWKWRESALAGVTASSGTVMLAALPIVLAVQFLTSFLNYDFQSVPREPMHKRLSGTEPTAADGRALISQLVPSETH